MPSDVPRENGTRAERAAARKYGLRLAASDSGFWDAAYRSNGRKVGVKSARYERADGPGVFRLWRENLRELAQVRGTVALVVVNPANPDRKVLKVSKRSARDVLDAAAGRWRETGQADMAGLHEARLPWPELVTLG